MQNTSGNRSREASRITLACLPHLPFLELHFLVLHVQRAFEIAAPYVVQLAPLLLPLALWRLAGDRVVCDSRRMESSQHSVRTGLLPIS